MLCNPAPTAFDLRFSLFGIPIRVHPLFWLFSIFTGWNPDQPNLIVIWVACVFVSILVHELGHALTAQWFGWPPEIVLYGMGGLAVFHPSWGRTRTRMVLTLLAGPGAGFMLYGLVQAGLLIAALNHRDVVEAPYTVYFAVIQLIHINLWWGLVNLLPIYPLDGGQIMRELLSWYFPRRATEYSLKVSMVLGGIVALVFFRLERQMPAMLFAILAIENYMTLQNQQY